MRQSEPMDPSGGPRPRRRIAGALAAVAAASAAVIAAFVARDRGAGSPAPAPTASVAAPDEEDEPEIDAGPSTGVTCGGSECPALDGYAPACNARHRCEYARTGSAAPSGDDDRWIYVRATAFTMGSEGGEGTRTEEKPAHTVALLRGFFIGRDEVTTALYEACEAAGKCTAPAASREGSPPGGRAEISLGDLGVAINRSAEGRALHPQNGLDWEQARAACAWLGGRLPSEAEWELVAGRAHRYAYPWGESPPGPRGPRTGNFADRTAAARWPRVRAIEGYDDGYADTAPVGSFPDGLGKAYGARDLAGNVAEWVEDCWHDSYDGAPADGVAWTSGCSGAGEPRARRVVRGGSFLDRDVRVVARDRASPEARSPALGVRCARTAPSIAPDDEAFRREIVEVAAELRCLDAYVADPAQRPSERTRLLHDHGLAHVDPASSVLSRPPLAVPIRADVDPDAVLRVVAAADPRAPAAVDRAAAGCMPAVPVGGEEERARTLEVQVALGCAAKRGDEDPATPSRALHAAGISGMQATYAAERLERDAAYVKERDAKVAACAGRDGAP